MVRCLENGIIPYVITGDGKVGYEFEIPYEESPETEEPAGSLYGTQEEMMERAKEGYFVRDPERNLVYCSNGESLRQKCVKKMEISDTPIRTHAGTA